MNSKIKTYILIGITLVVWGTIGYKFINGLNPEPSKQAEQFNTEVFRPSAISKTEKFSIKNVKRDPFLGTFAGSKIKVPKTSKVKKTTQQPEKKVIITYGGLIKKQNSNNLVFVINIDSKQYLLKKGQTVENIKLIKGNSAEIVINHLNKVQTIKRN